MAANATKRTETPAHAAPKPLAVLIVTDPDAEHSADALAISGALSAVGHLVLGVRAGDASLPEAMAHLKPDVVVVKSDSAVRDVLEHIVMATRDARRPVVMFTENDDRPTMKSALGAGVAAYVVQGLRPERVRAVIDVAVERFAAETALRNELSAAKTELADHKLIDRAKRTLMRKRGMDEPGAHRALQDLAMRKGLKLREAAERLLDVEDLIG
jgi:two-component system, response regulator / RNA-binding antiterminator